MNAIVESKSADILFSKQAGTYLGCESRIASCRVELGRALRVYLGISLWSGVRRLGGQGEMHRRLGKSVVAVAAAVAFAACSAPDVRAQDGSAQAAAALPTAVPGEASVRIVGDAAALELHVHRSTVADVLSALAGFNIRYRSPGALNEAIDGVYTGSLGRVLSRVLSGYDYAIKTDNEKLEVIVVGRSGEHAVPAPIVIPIRRRPSD